jgi:hypothetical protein
VTGVQTVQGIAGLTFATLAAQFWVATCPPLDEIAWMVAGCPDAQEMRALIAVMRAMAVVLVVLAVFSLRLATR